MGRHRLVRLVRRVWELEWFDGFRARRARGTRVPVDVRLMIWQPVGLALFLVLMTVLGGLLLVETGLELLDEGLWAALVGVVCAVAGVGLVVLTVRWLLRPVDAEALAAERRSHDEARPHPVRAVRRRYWLRRARRGSRPTRL